MNRLFTACILLIGLGAAADEGGAAYESVVVKGTVVELSEALKAFKLKVDPESVTTQVVVRSADGTLTPILSDDASRALFKDGRLRGRPAEIQGRRYRGLPFLQVVSFKIEENGKLQTPEYYCEICSISVRFPQICPCCQGPMELRMTPERQ